MVLDAFLRLDLATAQELGVALLAAAERHGDEVISSRPSTPWG
jgi:hypothetical protein